MSIGRGVGASSPVEVIVVDNGSTDRTEATFKAARGAFSKHKWRYVYEPMPGLLSGRHRGAREAKGDVLAYLDDDVVLAPTWLEALEEAFRDRKAVLVGGPRAAF